MLSVGNAAQRSGDCRYRVVLLLRCASSVRTKSDLMHFTFFFYLIDEYMARIVHGRATPFIAASCAADHAKNGPPRHPPR